MNDATTNERAAAVPVPVEWDPFPAVPNARHANSVLPALHSGLVLITKAGAVVIGS